MNSFFHLCNLFEKFRKEYLIFLNLIRTNSSKNRIADQKCLLEKILDLLKKEMIKVKEKYNKITQLNQEKSKKEELNNKLIYTQDLLTKGLNALTYKIPFFDGSSSEASVKTNSFSPKELINFAFRLNKQNKFPIDLQIKQLVPGAFLRPYPHEDIEITKSVLLFDLREEKRMPSPTVEPPPGKVRKGTFLKIFYKKEFKEEERQNFFFKYTMSTNEIPSFFTGELYTEASPPTLENEKCEVKVCACCPGFKDSSILTYTYFVISDGGKGIVEAIQNKEKDNVARRPSMEIFGGTGYDKVNVSLDAEGSPRSSSAGGSVYQPSIWAGKKSGDSDSSVYEI